MPTHLEDLRLVRRLHAGDERAFNRFFEDNFARLFRFALARVNHDDERARDVAQAALTRAVRKLHSYRGEASLFTWLCVICRNELVDQARREARHRHQVVLIEDDAEIRAAIESLEGPLGAGPGANYQRHEAARLIQVALDRLPPHYGNALEWKYVEGRSVREIAQRLDLSVEAAQSLLARAKRAFRELYGTLMQPLLPHGEAGETGA